MATQPVNLEAGALNLGQRQTFLRYVKSFAETCQTELGTFRDLLRWRDRAYQLQLAQTADSVEQMRKTMAGSAKRKIGDLQVPVVMPQVESAVAYQAGVFLTSYPIFGVIAPSDQMAVATQMETVLASHAKQYGWARALIRTMRRGFKYNFGPVFVHWKNRQQYEIKSSTDAETAGMAQASLTSAGGNCITDIDPYNCFFDFRVNPGDYHNEGEIFGWNTLISRTALKRLVKSLDQSRVTNLREAFSSGGCNISTGQTGSALEYHVPDINTILRPDTSKYHGGTNWLNFVGLEGSDSSRRIPYKDFYTLTPVVVRALPSDFGKYGPGSNTPTLYYALIVNWEYVIYLQAVPTAYDLFPIIIYQPNDDGLGHQSQSMVDVSLPFQDMSSSLWNMNLDSKRRAVFDRLLYNPKHVNKADIDPAQAVARIPVRNVSQLKDGSLQSAIHQIPYREDNVASGLQMSEMISSMADTAAGQNRVSQGQFQKGNKTKTEFDTTMANSNARPQLVALSTEEQFFTPVKEIIKANTLMNQTGQTLFDPTSKKAIEVDPVALRKLLFQFRMTDGLLPSDKMLNSDLLMVFLQTAQAMPVLMSEYDVIGMFLYWAQLKGASWVDEFKRDPAKQQEFLKLYEQTSKAQNATPDQQIPGAGSQP